MPADISQSNTGMFVPETYTWDISQIESLSIDPALKETLIRLYRNTNNIAIALNQKETGVYPLAETVTNQAWFPNPTTSATTARQPAYRGNFRTVINTGQLANTGTTTIAHGLNPTANWTFTRIYGAASDTTNFNYIPLPYASPILANNIELSIDNTNVIITTGSNRTNFNVSYVVIEFLKN